VIKKRKKTKLNNYTIQHNETKASTDFRTYSLNTVMSDNVNINGATDQTVTKSIKTTEKA